MVFTGQIRFQYFPLSCHDRKLYRKAIFSKQTASATRLSDLHCKDVYSNAYGSLHLMLSLCSL